jgi:hypothetical protein
MIEAPTLNEILAHRRRLDRAACCILLAPRFSKVSQDEIIPRIGYLDQRSGKHVHFYCAGYGGYWHSDVVPDMENIGPVKYQDGTMIPWAFSQSLFAAFVDELENVTTWRYEGGTELILLDPSVDFSNALILNVDAMIADGGIRSSAELFESIIHYCRNAKGHPSAYDFSDMKGLQELGRGAVGLLALLPKPVQGLWERGRHYAVRNISI